MERAGNIAATMLGSALGGAIAVYSIVLYVRGRGTRNMVHR